MKNLFRWLVVPLCMVLLVSTGSAAPNVVVSLAPVHALVAGVMGRFGHAELLVPPGASPHTYRLRPSQVGSLSKADLVVVTGIRDVDGFVDPVLRQIRGGRVLRLVNAPNMRLLRIRPAGIRGLASQEVERQAPDIDGHIWLDPDNALAIVRYVGARLIAIDPGHEETYRKNVADLSKRLAALQQEMRRELGTVSGLPVIVYHDAYQYLEYRFGLDVVGSVSTDADHPPGARRMHEVRSFLENGRAVCLFSEPEVPDRVIRSMGTSFRHRMLDPVGSRFQPGRDLYFNMMRGLTVDIVHCLKEK